MKRKLLVPLIFLLVYLLALPVYAIAPPMPGTPTITSIKALSRQRIKVKWKKADRATSYQVEYSTSPSLRPAYRIVTTKKTYVTFACPYGNKRFYVSVHAINTKNHFSQHGFYSNTKSVYVKAAKPLKFTSAQLKRIKKSLKVPSSLKVTYKQGTPYYWAAGEQWLTSVSIYNRKKQLVAGASCNSFTGDTVRNIGMYGYAGYR